jgi:hypothetical protein
MWDTIIDEDPSAQILSAWIAKEELRTLLSTVRIGGDTHLTLHRPAPIPDLVHRLPDPPNYPPSLPPATRGGPKSAPIRFDCTGKQRAATQTSRLPGQN